MKTKIYDILNAYLSTPPPIIGGGYVEDFRIEPDFTRTSSLDEDTPTGQFVKGHQDESLLDYLPPLNHYTDLSASVISKLVNSYYNGLKLFKPHTKQHLKVFTILNSIIEDIEAEPAAIEAFGWR